MTVGERIKQRRLAIGMSADDLGASIGKSRATIYRYESGDIENVPTTIIRKMADALQTTVEYLMGWQDITSPSLSAELRSLGFMPPPKTVKKPRLGVISCGEPIDSEENFDGFDNVPENITCDFTLICEGDSMLGARIRDGDVVYIRQQPTVESGQIAAILIDGTEKLLKRVYIKKDSIVLQAENPAYEPLFFVGEEMNRVSIIGRAVGFTSVL